MTKIIALGGPIKWWWNATCLDCGHWDEAPIMEHQHCLARPERPGHNCYVWWNSPEHREFVAWRERVRAALIDAGYLTYAPWEGFKGPWDERAQKISDRVLEIADAFVVLSAMATDETEVERSICKIWDVPVLDWPPMPETVISDLLETLADA